MGLPAIAIEGPKAVGKTATARQLAKTIYELDDPEQLEVTIANPKRLLEGAPPILIDEWQRFPSSWDLVRRAVDDSAPAGRYLLTGSATPTNAPAHSGAGRIVSIRMRPFTLVEREVAKPTVSLSRLLSGDRPDVGGSSEIDLGNYVDEIVCSGFPGIRPLSERARRAQLDSYIAGIVERDFPELGHQVRNPAALKRWMAAYAAASSTTMSFEKIRDIASAGHNNSPSKLTVAPYRDVLERLWILDPVPAWQPTKNQVARLSYGPKHQLADPALAARLLGVTRAVLLEPRPLGHPIQRDGSLLGALFESLVTLNVRVFAQLAEASVFHLRTYRGDHEIDLIAQRQDGRVVAIEIKLKSTVDDSDVKHINWLRKQIGNDLLDAVVVTTGQLAYRRQDGIAVVPAALLGP